MTKASTEYFADVVQSSCHRARRCRRRPTHATSRPGRRPPSRARAELGAGDDGEAPAFAKGGVSWPAEWPRVAGGAAAGSVGRCGSVARHPTIAPITPSE